MASLLYNIHSASERRLLLKSAWRALLSAAIITGYTDDRRCARIQAPTQLLLTGSQYLALKNNQHKVVASSHIANHVDDEDKLRTQIGYAGQKREVTIINESGLYSLILTSKLPKAREFKHWVTNDVLPKIRQTGACMTHDTMMQMMQQPEQVVLLCRW